MFILGSDIIRSTHLLKIAFSLSPRDQVSSHTKLRVHTIIMDRVKMADFFLNGAKTHPTSLFLNCILVKITEKQFSCATPFTGSHSLNALLASLFLCRCWILLLHHAFHFLVPLCFGSFSSFLPSVDEVNIRLGLLSCPMRNTCLYHFNSRKWLRKGTFHTGIWKVQKNSYFFSNQ